MNYNAGVVVLFGVGVPVALLVGIIDGFTVGFIVADTVLIVGTAVALGVLTCTVGTTKRIMGVGTIVGVCVGVIIAFFTASASFFAVSACVLVIRSPRTATRMSTPIPDAMMTI